MRLRWAPAVVLILGAVALSGVGRQRTLPLDRPIPEVIPEVIQGYVGEDFVISDPETEVSGVSNYLQRVYNRPSDDTIVADTAEASTDWFSLYIGYYESQAQGKTIHSPKNCLPGAGWEALSADALTIEVEGREVQVNRYVLQNDLQRAMALYWYQGRGRVAYDEYRVKLNLLWDAALRRRSDEALVRIVVPLDDDEAAAVDLATRVARDVIPALNRALPN